MMHVEMEKLGSVHCRMQVPRDFFLLGISGLAWGWGMVVENPGFRHW